MNSAEFYTSSADTSISNTGSRPSLNRVAPAKLVCSRPGAPWWHPRTRLNDGDTEPRSAFVSPNVKQSSILAWCRVPFVCRALGDIPVAFGSARWRVSNGFSKFPRRHCHGEVP